MRLLLVFPLVLAVSAQAQTVAKHLQSAEGCKGLATDWYYQAVSERIVPPDGYRQLIQISISVTGRPKLILRTDGHSYGLLQGTPETNIYRFLLGLDESCKLPLDPAEAADLVKVNWEHTALSAARFGQLHSDFASAFSQYASSIKTRYSSLIGTRMKYLNLHTAKYSVTYDNGFEHTNIKVDDSTDDPAKMDPIVKWGRSVLSLAEALFEKE